MYQKKFEQISKEKKESDWQIRHWFVCAGKIHRLMIQINQVNCIHQCMHTQSCTNRRWRLIFNHYDYRPEINSFYKINFQWRCNQNHCEKDIHYLWQNEIKKNKIKTSQKISHGHKYNNAPSAAEFLLYKS